MGCRVRRDMLHIVSRQSDWSETVPPHTRYDRVATSYSQYRPRYPDVLVAHLAAIIEAADAAEFVFKFGSGTGAFTRQLRPALPGSGEIDDFV